MTSWRSASATHVGLVREANEDSLYVDDRIALVADGMGGHAAGEVASELAISIYQQHLANDPSLTGLAEGLAHANQNILEDARAHPERQGMGTTLTGVALIPYDSGHAVAWANIGDSRLYLVRNGLAQQVTDDHSVAEEWVRQGRITKAEAAVHPRRHQLTRVLGMDVFTDGDTGLLPVVAGDRLVLCSDGLSNEVSDAEIAEVVAGESDLHVVCDQLVQRALNAGGRDNISVVVLEIESVDVVIPDTPVRSPMPSESPAAPPVRRQSRSMPTFFRYITWRSSAFAGAVLALGVGVFVVFGWFAQSGYYLANENGRVAVYQGHAGGFLWYQPKQVLITDFKMTELRPGDAEQINANLTEPSLSAAIRHVANMHDQWRMTQPVVTTSTTTTVP